MPNIHFTNKRRGKVINGSQMINLENTDDHAELKPKVGNYWMRDEINSKSAEMTS